MNKELLDKVLADLNALITDEVASVDPGHYKRVMKLAAYAERIRQMDNMRVAGVTDRNGRAAPRAPGVPYWRDDRFDAIDAQIDMEANAGEGHVNYPMLGGGLLGGFPQHEDAADLTREAIMAAREAKAPTAGKLADELSSLLDVEERLARLDTKHEHDALGPIRDSIKAVTAKLNALTKPRALASTIHQAITAQQKDADHAHPEVAHPIVLRRHPPDLDVGQDVHAARGEADREGARGAPGPRAEGTRERVDLA